MYSPIVRNIPATIYVSSVFSILRPVNINDVAKREKELTTTYCNNLFILISLAKIFEASQM